MPTVELNLKQVVQAVKQLPPKEKVILWEQIGDGIARVTTKIRSQAKKLGLTEFSDREINKFIHQIRKERE